MKNEIQIVVITIIFMAFCWICTLIATEIEKEAYKVEFEKWINEPIFHKELKTEDIIRAVWQEDSWIALKIAKCESGLNPRAKNPDSTACGLFQTLKMHHYPGYDCYDPWDNSILAYKLFKQSGTQPWSSSQHCWDN